MHPFIHEFPIFEKFLYVGHVLGSTHEFPNDYRYNVLEELLKDDYYILILALYYKLIGYFFSNDWGSNTVFRWNNIPDQVVFNDGMTMSELLLGNRDLKALLLRGNSLFQGITKRSYGSCPIGKKFDNALDYLENLKDIRNAGLENGVDDFINRTISTGENALRNMREELKNIK